MERTDAPEDARDIDTHGDAVMYMQAESLERLLSLTANEEKRDRPVTCAASHGLEVCRRSDETFEDNAHAHGQTRANAFVSVSAHGDASGTNQVRKGKNATKKLRRKSNGRLGTGFGVDGRVAFGRSSGWRVVPRVARVEARGGEERLGEGEESIRSGVVIRMYISRTEALGYKPEVQDTSICICVSHINFLSSH